jgi:hypothetical protein
MDVWFWIEQEPLAERHERELKNPKEFVPALLRSASGELLPS